MPIQEVPATPAVTTAATELPAVIPGRLQCVDNATDNIFLDLRSIVSAVVKCFPEQKGECNAVVSPHYWEGTQSPSSSERESKKKERQRETERKRQ